MTSCYKKRRAERGEAMHHNEYKSQLDGERTLYRARDGAIFGVCKGIAEWRDLPVGVVRLCAVFLAIFSSFWPAVIIYIVAAMLMKVEPVVPFESEADEEFYTSYSTSRHMAIQRLKRSFDNLDQRIQRMENAVTARDYEWEERLNG